GRRRAGVQVDDVLFPGEVGNGEADTGAREVDEHIDLLDVDPLLADIGADVGLVLVIGRDQVDLPALGEKAGILDRHLRGDGRAGAANISVEAGLVAETSHLDDFVERLRKSAGGKNQACGHDQSCYGSLHLSSRNFFLNVCWNNGAIMPGLVSTG